MNDTITQSPETDKVFGALITAQSQFPVIPKTATNPFFKSKYADLPAVVGICGPILFANGLAVTQHPSFFEGEDVLTTRLIHTSGQFIESTMRLLLVKADSQGQGSAITYARRYAYSGILGIVTDTDDDGNAASDTSKSAKAPAKTAPAVEGTPMKEGLAQLLKACGGNRDDANRVWSEFKAAMKPATVKIVKDSGVLPTKVLSDLLATAKVLDPFFDDEAPAVAPDTTDEEPF